MYFLVVGNPLSVLVQVTITVVPREAVAGYAELHCSSGFVWGLPPVRTAKAEANGRTSRRALALLVTIQVNRYCLILAVKCSLPPPALYYITVYKWQNVLSHVE